MIPTNPQLFLEDYKKLAVYGSLIYSNEDLVSFLCLSAIVIWIMIAILFFCFSAEMINQKMNQLIIKVNDKLIIYDNNH